MYFDDTRFAFPSYENKYGQNEGVIVSGLGNNIGVKYCYIGI